VTVRVTPRSGAWSDINERRGSSEVRTERYADVGMDHGVAPEGAGYAYVMLPGASRAATAAYSLAPDIRILAQSADASAVEERALDAVAVSVWNPEGASVERDGRATWLTTDAACLITVERDGDDYLVSLADPTQAHEGVISLTLELGDVMAVADSSRVRAQGIEGGVRVEFDVSGMRGAALTARLRPVT
jgi:hyaluronate lyase